MPHYAEFILTFSVNLTIEDLGLLDTQCSARDSNPQDQMVGGF